MLSQVISTSRRMPPRSKPMPAARVSGVMVRQYSSRKKLEGSISEQHMEQMPPTRLITFPSTLYACTAGNRGKTGCHGGRHLLLRRRLHIPTAGMVLQAVAQCQT